MKSWINFRHICSNTYKILDKFRTYILSLDRECLYNARYVVIE